MTSQQTSPMAPEQFWAHFSKLMSSKWNSQGKMLYDGDGKEWTAFLTKLLVEMAVEFGYIAATEYWPRVDVSYFDQSGQECPDWAEWSREVAIEIENNDFFTQEICKLMEINAGLKVLIAYSPTWNDIRSVLDRFPAIYMSRKYITSPCNWLFIFGPHGPDGGELKDFKAFKYDGHNIIDITGDTKIITMPATNSANV
jgi:hypothetical protein